jgi:hypothetical protein
VVFRRLLVLLALLASAAACTLPNDPSQTAGGQSRAGIPTLPRELGRDVGAAYPDAALQASIKGLRFYLLTTRCSLGSTSIHGSVQVKRNSAGSRSVELTGHDGVIVEKITNVLF